MLEDRQPSQQTIRDFKRNISNQSEKKKKMKEILKIML